tara:strand:- start:1303 stop:1872 length:570 start_codon:yes stop_codon:yes gene_type:complete
MDKYLVKISNLKKINVIDLDNTLIPYDSFKKYLIMFLLSKNYTIKILYLIILKFFRMINKNEFKERVYSITVSGKDYSSRMKDFSKMLNSSINPVILSDVKKHTDKNTINILVTASYEAYAKYVAGFLSWDCIASNIVKGRFIHSYGIEKFRLISERYPKEKYQYNYCISDSTSDLEMMSKFKKSCLFK